MSKNDKFPRGKLSADDEGQLGVAIGVRDKTLVIDFGKPVVWIGLDYFSAMQLADLIVSHAAKIAPPGPKAAEAPSPAPAQTSE